MKNLVAACAVLVSTFVFADTKETPPAMDMTKMGPAARKVTDEKKTRKEIDEHFKKADEADKKGDMDAAINAIDFPIFMATDDLKGVPEAQSYTREQYVSMMKPFWEGMPKDMTMTHKRTVTVLSDSLANVVDDFTQTMGKMKVTGKNLTLLVKVGADWKTKAVVEAGWGGVPGPAVPEAKPAPAPAPAPAKK